MWSAVWLILVHVLHSLLLWEFGMIFHYHNQSSSTRDDHLMTKSSHYFCILSCISVHCFPILFCTSSPLDWFLVFSMVVWSPPSPAALCCYILSFTRFTFVLFILAYLAYVLVLKHSISKSKHIFGFKFKDWAICILLLTPLLQGC